MLVTGHRTIIEDSPALDFICGSISQSLQKGTVSHQNMYILTI